MSLNNSGQVVNGEIGPEDIDIDWLEAMDIFSGSVPVVVAVLDTGVTLYHPEIRSKIWINDAELYGDLDDIDDDSNGFLDDAVGWDFFDDNFLPLDENGHGTLIASIIASTPDNGEMGVGVFPITEVIALRIANDFGSLGDIITSTVNILEATTYAANNCARIINASFGVAHSTFLNYSKWSG